MPLKLADDIFQKSLAVFTSLFLIALFIERALDVFLTTLRAEKSEYLQKEIKIEAQKLDKGESSIDELNRIKKVLLSHKANTRVIALWSALTIGIIISAIGFRALQPLINLEEFKNLPLYHTILFYIVDIFITGCVLAGGSDSIHKMTDAFRLFMEKSQNKN